MLSGWKHGRGGAQHTARQNTAAGSLAAPIVQEDALLVRLQEVLLLLLPPLRVALEMA
jgi:hypothetical protein